jgi:integrase
MASGSVRRRGAGWEWRTRSPEGKEISRGGFRTRKEAKDDLALKVAAMVNRAFAEPDKLTTGIFLTERWLPAVKATVEATTYANYRIHVVRHLVPRIGDVPLQKLSVEDLLAAYSDLLERGRIRGGSGPLSSRTVRHIHTTIHKALADAKRWKKIAFNPADDVDPPKLKRTEIRAWDVVSLQAFLDGVMGEREYPMWRFLALTGCRRSDALGLNWEHLDLVQGRADIEQVRTTSGVQSTKTENSQRSIDLDADTVTILQSWAGQQLDEAQEWGECWTNTGMVFVREDGKGYHPDGVSGMFERHVHRLGLPRITLHGLRHTHATLLLKSGVSPHLVSIRLGHSSVAFTLTTYAHVLPGQQQEAVETLSAALRFRGQSVGSDEEESD